MNKVKRKYDIWRITLPIKLEKDKPIIVLSVSGGKDSLASWLLLSRTGKYNLVPVVYCSGWDWYYAINEIKRVEQITGDKVMWLEDSENFNRAFEKRGFPRWGIRWCTGMKVNFLRKYANGIKRVYRDFNVYEAIGIAADEVFRIKNELLKNRGLMFPLVDFGISERMAFVLCVQAGCTWDNKYLQSDRISCWCCPFQKRDSFLNIYLDHPDLWGKLKYMDTCAPKGRKFRWHGKSLDIIEQEFKDQGILLRG